MMRMPTHSRYGALPLLAMRYTDVVFQSKIQLAHHGSIFLLIINQWYPLVSINTTAFGQLDVMVREHPACFVNISMIESIFFNVQLGAAYRRCGFSMENDCGTFWKLIDDAPKGTMLKQISVGSFSVWAIDGQGQLLVRREICDAFPEGSHWQILQNILNDPPHEDGKMGFRSVSVNDSNVWAVSNSNFVCRRSGVTASNPAGTGWQLGISVSVCDWVTIACSLVIR